MLAAGRPDDVHALMAGHAPDSAQARIDAAGARSPWSGVGALRTPGGVFTGVAVGDRLVLTAAHVVASQREHPAKVVFVTATASGSTRFAVGAIHVHPGYRFPFDDLALLELADDLPPEVRRYALAGAPLRPATRLDMVGYGRSGQGDRGPSGERSEHVRRVGENVADALLERLPGQQGESAFYIYDFDGPVGHGPLGQGTLGNARETMVGHGDSGAPAFVRSRAGAPLLVGINTVAMGFAAGRPARFMFGDGGAGIDLTHPRFRAWLDETGQGRIRWAPPRVRRGGPGAQPRASPQR